MWGSLLSQCKMMLACHCHVRWCRLSKIWCRTVGSSQEHSFFQLSQLAWTNTMRLYAGVAELVELDGPFVKLRLTGRFWHERSMVLARLANYLQKRIPVCVLNRNLSWWYDVLLSQFGSRLVRFASVEQIPWVLNASFLWHLHFSLLSFLFFLGLLCLQSLLL